MQFVDALPVLAVLGTGVVYGVDVFFALIGRRALAESSDAAIADVMGRLHQVADARMPIFGVTGLLATIASAAVSPIGTTTIWLNLIAIAGLLVQLSLYLIVAKPINTKMTEAAQRKEVLSDIRELQHRWDSVIVARAIAMTLAVGCLITATSLR
ncbi:DUF1772 domain-containing protein [Nostoc sp. MS1]|uniref:DUF1772 domain-containing protein n=1 Tax=Nostoc sp. MS1 TaxID=2764711 RepID=UPI001CC4005B|nr:DUF1772 domain-containing protein [Nostoc sp. MS1]BCL38438.1 hypothetical protein NSMS1_48850 [Nostoc sp. MS1]